VTDPDEEPQRRATTRSNRKFPTLRPPNRLAISEAQLHTTVFEMPASLPTIVMPPSPGLASPDLASEVGTISEVGTASDAYSQTMVNPDLEDGTIVDDSQSTLSDARTLIEDREQVPATMVRSS